MQVDMFQMFNASDLHNVKKLPIQWVLKVSSYNGTRVCLPIKSPNCKH